MSVCEMVRRFKRTENREMSVCEMVRRFKRTENIEMFVCEMVRRFKSTENSEMSVCEMVRRFKRTENSETSVCEMVRRFKCTENSEMSVCEMVRRFKRSPWAVWRGSCPVWGAEWGGPRPGSLWCRWLHTTPGLAPLCPGCGNPSPGTDGGGCETVKGNLQVEQNQPICADDPVRFTTCKCPGL